MARLYPWGYISVSTNKYGYPFKYGEILYGVNYPPPQPENFTVENYPTIVDTTPKFLWIISYGAADPIQYELEINFGSNDFTSPTVTTNLFSASIQEYDLAPEYELASEGVYYARIRSTDGWTYSAWSDVLSFTLFITAPYPPTIDTVISPADDFWQLLTGTKQPNLYVFVRNNEGDWAQASYPAGIAGTTWQYNMALQAGDNEIEAVTSYAPATTGALSDPAEASIYLVMSTPVVFNVWNAFDEFGLLLSLNRIPGERNRDYKNRLLDVYQNPANSTYSGVRYGIARELGLTYGDISVERLSDLADPDYAGNILNIDNNALGTKLEDYADEVYDNNPIFFGTVICDESYWDGVDEETSGYTYLPHQWDPNASGIYDKWQGAGIGDNDDLWVGDIKEIWNPGISGYAWYLPIHTGYFYSSYPSGVIGV